MVKRINLYGEDLYEVDEILSQYNISTTFFQRKEIKDSVIHFGGKDYINKENYIRYDALAKAEQTCYKISDVEKKLNITTDTINNKSYILSVLFNETKCEGHLFYGKEEVDKYKHKNEKYPISSVLSDCIGYSVIYCYEFINEAINRKIKLLDRRTPLEYIMPFMFSNKELVSVYGNVCIKSAIDDMEVLLKNNNRTPSELFDNYFSQFSKFSNSVSLMKCFYFDKINKSKSPNATSVAINYIKQLANIYKLLNKDIFLYQQKEIYKLISKRQFNNRTAMQFLEYVKANTVNNFGKIAVFVYKANNSKTTDDLYTYDEWIAGYEYLNDLSIHLEKAYENRLYSQYWLIMLIHYVSALRISDIVDLDAIYLDGTRFVQTEELLHTPLTLGEAQKIVNAFKEVLITRDIVKTGERKHFYPRLSIIEALGSAIAILEYHRIMNDDIDLFTIKSVSTARIKEKFEDMPYEFSSTKATKTLLTITHDKMVDSSDSSNAYAIVSAMRSHKSAGSKFSETTSVYIQKASLDGDVEDVAYNICERGVFGWLYLALLQYAGGKITSLEEATTQIENLQSKISVDALENLSGFLLEEGERQKDVLSALSTYTRDEIKIFLNNIGQSMSASKIETISCIKGKECGKYGTMDCTLCPFSIYTTYSLKVLNDRLLYYIKKLKDIPQEDVVLRKKYTYFIQKILLVFTDAKLELLERYGDDFFKSFVDLPEIHKQLLLVSDDKFLRIEG